MNIILFQLVLHYFGHLLFLCKNNHLNITNTILDLEYISIKK